MDFAFTEEQTALGDLARRLCEEHATPEAWRRVEQRNPGWLPELWQALAASELLGVAVPTELGGAGLGLLELCKVLEALGGAAAPVPAWATLALAAPALARFGTPAQRELLGGVCRGETVLSAALVERGEPVEARPDGAGFLLVGVCDAVPAGTLASHVLVPARTPEGRTIVALVRVGGPLPGPGGAPSAPPPGVEVAAQVGTSEEPLARLTLRGARVEPTDLVNGTDGAPVVALAREWGLVGQAALQLGVVARALRFTAQHAAERQQFDRPIGSFQAVAQRVGDAFVDVETLRLVTWRAAWLIDAGRPHEREVLVAKYWAAECGHRVVSAAQHIHGGLGFDRDYPLFRYYLLAKQLEFTLGGATAQLTRLGALIASRP